MKQVKFESDEYVFIEPILCKVKHRFKTKHGYFLLKNNPFKFQKLWTDRDRRSFQ